MHLRRRNIMENIKLVRDYFELLSEDARIKAFSYTSQVVRKMKVANADEAFMVSFDIGKSPEGARYWNNQIRHLKAYTQEFIKPGFNNLKDFNFHPVRINYAIKETGRPCYIDCMYHEAEGIKKELKTNKWFTHVEIGEIPKK